MHNKMIFNSSCVNQMFPLMTADTSWTRPQPRPPALAPQSLMSVSWWKRVSSKTGRVSEALSASSRQPHCADVSRHHSNVFCWPAHRCNWSQAEAGRAWIHTHTHWDMCTLFKQKEEKVLYVQVYAKAYIYIMYHYVCIIQRLHHLKSVYGQTMCISGDSVYF